MYLTTSSTHLTSNNTIFGTQYKAWPSGAVYHWCVTCHLIYFQNPLMFQLGPDLCRCTKIWDLLYVTLVVVKKSALGTVSRYLPTMLNYAPTSKRIHVNNTPPVFAIYEC